ncbi:hypothetical protein PHET_03921 [Paragonimus heterotremus]|uniref:LIM zinc-binding domain-containing protein n=1 Tax=Paragonimus heterotremus TaxID=100268 RepID=A0A8J4TIZ2_9TREM|nr:hypothetical protein PHET_03921 [Paragonimus heterotremus]
MDCSGCSQTCCPTPTESCTKTSVTDVCPTSLGQCSQESECYYEKRPVHLLGRCCICCRYVQPGCCLPLNGRLYHFECLSCATCGKRLGRYTFNECDGKVYCCGHYPAAVDSKIYPLLQPINIKPPPTTCPGKVVCLDQTPCYACGRKVYMTEMLRVMDRIYHKSCFKCQKCCTTLNLENYQVLDGAPFCKAHYKQLMNTRECEIIHSRNCGVIGPSSVTITETYNCPACSTPVDPPHSIKVQEEYYHPNCFKCTHCGRTLNIAMFEIAQGRLYCPEDYLQIFGRQQSISSKQSLMVLSDQVKNRWHPGQTQCNVR